MNVNNVIRLARKVTRMEEEDPCPTPGPLADAIKELRKELAPRVSLLDGVIEGRAMERRQAGPIVKAKPVRCKDYLRLVAARPCKYCGAVNASQAAHENHGKGLGQKTDDRRTFPLCHVGANDCHGRFDRYELFMGRAQHIAMGRVWAQETAQEIRAEGLWPRGLEYPY